MQYRIRSEIIRALEKGIVHVKEDEISQTLFIFQP